jgi:hypothetical protein
MVTVAGIKIPTKKERKNPMFSDEQFIGSEPDWTQIDTANMSDEEFETVLRRSFNYYNYFFSQKDSWKEVIQWLQQNSEFTTIELKAFIKSDPKKLPMTACSLVRAVKAGMPIREKHAKFIIDEAQKIIDANINTVEMVEKVAPTIQERIAEKMVAVIAEMDNAIDVVFQGKPSPITVYDFLTANNVPQAQISKIRERFNRQLTELAQAAGGKFEDLSEAYSHIIKNKKLLKHITDFYAKMMADFHAYVQVKKVTKKARVKKAPTKDKIVAKVKYMKECKELKLISVNPTDILNAKAVWVYNTKYRKIGRYEAEDGATLGIQGTTITNFSEVKSVSKTLRKPADQLKEFAKAGKVALRTFLKNINSVETKLNGRLNEEIIILKVE